MIKPNLLILSDMFGFANCKYIEKYTTLLNEAFQIDLVDVLSLSQIELNTPQSLLHQAYVKQGISIAVNKVLNIYQGEFHILAFSIGGTIAWQSILKGLNAQSLTCISSTRLRYETQLPASRISLHFGSEDNFKPSKEWILKDKLDYNNHEACGHHLYKMDSFIIRLTKKLNSQYGLR